MLERTSLRNRWFTIKRLKIMCYFYRQCGSNSEKKTKEKKTNKLQNAVE